MNQPLPPLNAPSQTKTSGMAIWSLVLGILSLICFSILSAIPGVICGHMALGRIKRSNGALSGQGLAIGGLVTGYLGILLAVVTIPMMLAIAIPNFTKARNVALTNACINNLRQIDSAKQEWALENKKPATAIPTESDLASNLKSGMPKCPAGGTYKLNAVNEAVTCSVPGHKLPNQ
jgi:competence protein ComGC